MSPVIGVLADDLTGALASAGRLRDGGLCPVVQWRPERVSGAVNAVVADMRTRDYGTDAERRARTWAGQLRNLGCARLELRTDSTLRGDPTAELAGALAGWAAPDPWVLAVPAFPDAARSVVGGRLVADVDKADVDKADVDKADVDKADDGASGHGISVARVLFPEQPEAEVALLSLALIEQGPQAVADAITDAAESGIRRFVADTTREDHLRALASASGLLIGQAVPLITASPGAWLRYLPAPRAVPSYVLVVLSSATHTNQQQLAELRRRRRSVVVVGAREVLAGETRLDWSSIRHNRATVVVETLSAPPRDAADAWPLASVAARAAAYVLDDGLDGGCCSCAGVVVSGGHTASALVDVLGVRWLDADGELAPLCPRARLRGGAWTGMRVVTKGGLVGTAGTLTGLVDVLWREGP